MPTIKTNIQFTQQLLEAILKLADSYKYICFFNPEGAEPYPYGGFPHQLAMGSQKIDLETDNNFDSLQKHLGEKPLQKLFGYLSYELKNETEALTSKNKELIAWENMGFFQADCIVSFEDKQIIIEAEDPEYYLQKISELKESLGRENKAEPQGQLNAIAAQTSRKQYIDTVNRLKQHILEGDIYELNYCINFTAQVENFDPLSHFIKLSEHSPTPFAALLKWEHQYVLCASPERFMKYEQGKIISQPIKGTSRRSEDAAADELSKTNLKESEKERAENMMIVDLVRNDLARSAETGSVKVEELFGIYSFKQVHQMISTITAVPKKEMPPVQIIKNAFPMGSMTGAPKIRAMQLIEEYEELKRNIFSGSIGYFHGNQSFDFNVVIRSIFYDKKSKIVHYQVGSAITYDAIAEKEYEECLLKAAAIRHILLG